DGDGDLDVLMACGGHDILYRNDGGGTFSDASANLPTPWGLSRIADLGDYDGDGDLDALVSSGLYLNDGAGVFSGPSGGTTFARHASFGDIDGDGDLDGVCCGGGGPSFQWPELDFASTFELATNRGGGDFAPAFRFPGAGSESLAGAADLDGDGDLELVAGRCVYYGNGPWLEQPMPTAGGPDALATLRIADLEDVDRDGDPDFGPMVNRGDGAFEPEAAEPAPPTGYSYQFSAIRCDVDGDGVRDRIRYLNQDGVGFAGMVWLRNNGGGHLTYEGPVAAPTTWIANNSVDEILARDLDGDGDDDLFVQGLAFIWWNQGGYFPGPGQQPIGNVILQGVGDLDLDGIPDLVVTAGDTVKVLAGTGQPSAPFVQVWSHTSPYLLLHEPCLVLLEDLNGDGRLDFVRRWWDGRLRLFVNETAAAATPWLSAPITLPGDEIEIPLSGQSRPTLTAGDIDGDGGVDLIACRLKDGPNLGCVLRRQTTDPLNHGYDVQHFVLGNGFLVDADGDGDLDVVGERTVRNRRFDRVGGGRRVQRHDGVSGESGAAPVLGGTGPYIAGGSHTIHLTGVPGPAVALIGLSIGDAYLVDNPLPGLTLYLDPSWMLVGTMPITENGHGRAAAMASVTLPIFPGTAGWTFHLQAFVPDPVAPPQYTQSNLLSLRIRN
ncbi:MAG: VCBS repeat-containing protein, partial [Planctomycetes bacterium]|nr:VCBS repeat-containing protein [Planctomycetota bacterium]